MEKTNDKKGKEDLRLSYLIRTFNLFDGKLTDKEIVELINKLKPFQK